MSEFIYHIIYYCHSSTFFSIFLVLGPLDPSLLGPAWLFLQAQNKPQIGHKLWPEHGDPKQAFPKPGVFPPPRTRPVRVHASHAMFQPTTRPPWHSWLSPIWQTNSRMAQHHRLPSFPQAWFVHLQASVILGEVCMACTSSHLKQAPSTFHFNISIVRLSLSHKAAILFIATHLEPSPSRPSLTSPLHWSRTSHPSLLSFMFVQSRATPYDHLEGPCSRCQPTSTAHKPSLPNAQ